MYMLKKLKFAVILKFISPEFIFILTRILSNNKAIKSIHDLIPIHKKLHLEN